MMMMMMMIQTGRASQTCLDLPGRYPLLRPIRRYATGQGVVFDLSVLNEVYIVCVCQQGIACTIDLICKINFVSSQLYKRL